MLIDRYSGMHSSQSAAAVDHFAAATYEVAAHRPDAADQLGKALDADPGCIAAHALKGLACLILARSELRSGASVALGEARRFADERGATAFEQMLIEVLQIALDRRLKAAADRVDTYLDRHPESLLAAKLSQSFRFMAGDRVGMIATAEKLIPKWNESLAGHGFVLGLHSFALEEMGRYDEAENVGRRAVDHEPADSWALHSVAHVYEMMNRPVVGADWLDGLRPTWRKCNNFGFHVAWHRALFDLELGHIDKVLALYDEEVRPTPTDDFRDVSNGVSMLWRLEQEGIDVGDRWAELAEIARRRTDDMSLMFAALHNLIALVASGDWNHAHKLVASIRDTAECGIGDQKNNARTVALPLAELILVYGRSRMGDIGLPLGEIASKIQMIGGSHAQRDVFVRTLAMYAAQHGDPDGLRSVLKVRHALKKRDRFSRLVEARLAMVRPSMHLTPEGAAAFRA